MIVSRRLHLSRLGSSTPPCRLTTPILTTAKMFREPRLISMCGRRVVFECEDDLPLYSLSRRFAINDPGAFHRDSHRQYLFDSASSTSLVAEETASSVSGLVSAKSRKRGLGADSNESVASAASEAAAAAAAALASAPPPTIATFSETHDVMTTLPIFNMQLPLPLPHTDASLQKIQLPQTCASSLEDILPRPGATSHQQVFDLSRAHISYFQNLKAWFYSVHQQRKQRYKNRLAILGMHGGVLDSTSFRGGLRDSPNVLAAMAGLSSSPSTLEAASLSHPVDDSRSVDALAMLGMISSTNDLQEPIDKKTRIS